MTHSDQALVDYVQKVIRTGATSIAISAVLLEGASPAFTQEVWTLCRINGVNIQGVCV